MFANYMSMMQHTTAGSAMSAEAAASSCAISLLDSAYAAESIFVVLITVWVLVRILIFPFATVF